VNGSPEPRRRCISVHAERLEREDVWRRTDAFLRRLERSGGRATVFVHPRSAIAAGASLDDRVRSMLDRGHEIGQHTHFYAQDDTEANGGPRTDLSVANVRRCLDRDHGFLERAGAEPRGFVAGAWAVVEEVLPWLRGHGFRYDATVRAFPLPYGDGAVTAGDGWTAARVDGGVVRLPTTAPVSWVVRRRARPARAASAPYDLLYLHDYDLLRPGPRLAAAVTLATSRGIHWATASDLAGLAVNEDRSA